LCAFFQTDSAAQVHPRISFPLLRQYITLDRVERDGNFTAVEEQCWHKKTEFKAIANTPFVNLKILNLAGNCGKTE